MPKVNTVSRLDAPIKDFRIVHVKFEGESYFTTSHVVHKDDLDKFIQATKELHVYKGDRNPITGTIPSKLREIRVNTFDPTGPYWWSTPGLTGNDNPEGVTIYSTDMCHGNIVWESEQLKKDNLAYYEAEQKAESQWE